MGGLEFFGVYDLSGEGFMRVIVSVLFLRVGISVFWFREVGR